jgi:hypothetical protein
MTNDQINWAITEEWEPTTEESSADQKEVQG